MTPTPDSLIIKTESCDPENHGTGIIFALEMAKETNRGIKEVLNKLERQEEENAIRGKTLQTIDSNIQGIQIWQREHDERIAKRQEEAEEKRKFWEPIKSTAITTAVRWAVGGALLLIGGALGSGLLSMARAKLEQSSYQSTVVPDRPAEHRHSRAPTE